MFLEVKNLFDILLKIEFKTNLFIMLLNRFTLHRPKKIEETIQLMSSCKNFKIQAGGSFLINSLKLMKRKGSHTPENIISLNHVEELRGVDFDGETLTIKAMTRIDDLYESNQLKGNLKILKQVCKNISTQPIRNMATIGGNLTCRYTWTEMPAVMIALDATLHFSTLTGDKETLAAEDFFKQAAKTSHLLTHITIPYTPDARISYQRVRKTQGVDIPLLSLMIRVIPTENSFSDVRIGINSCVNFSCRDTQLEEFLSSAEISNKLPEEALNHMDNEIYDKRGTDYKRHMFNVSVKNAIKEIL